MELSWDPVFADQAVATRRLLRSGVLRLFGVLAGLTSVAYLFLRWAGWGGPDPVMGVPLAVGLSALFGLVVREAVILRARYRWWRWPEVYAAEHATLRLDDEGVHLTSDRTNVAVGWGAIEGLVRTRRLWLLRLGSGSGLVVPRRAFSGSAQEAEFVRSTRERISAHAGEAAPPPAPAERPPVFDDPEALRLAWEAEPDDYVAFVRWARWDRRKHRWLSALLALVILVACVVGVVLGVLTGDQPVELLPFAVFAVFAVIIWVTSAWGGPLTAWSARRRIRRQPKVYPLGTRSLVIGPQGLFSENVLGAASLEWSQITDVVGHGRHTFLMLGPWHAWVVPDRAFAGPEEADRFRTRARSWRTRRREPARAGPRPSAENPFEAPGA